MSIVDTSGERTEKIGRLRDRELLSYRDVLLLEHHFKAGLNYSQLGSIFGIDPSVVGKRIRRIPSTARNRVRRLVMSARNHGGLTSEDLEAARSIIEDSFQ